MKAKIDKDGILWIERAGEMKQMRCVNRHDHYCRDVCPLFGEPDMGRDDNGYIDVKKDSTLLICGIILRGKIEDKRTVQA